MAVTDSPARKADARPKVKTRPDTPFPLKQLLILSLARFAEPIAFMSIFPYIYYMIRSFNITTDDRQISVYAGMVTSSFAIAECSCSAMWGRLSDRVGRKPVLLVGLSGTGISMLSFGFARSLKVALAARFIGGLLNGNGGVLTTMVAEIVTVKEHQPRAYTFLPLTWGMGSVIGAFLGGTLADPVTNYPNIFPAEKWPILVSYPFLLPNLFAAFMVIFGVLVATLFFHETHPTMQYKRDRGIELGNWLVRLLTRSPAKKDYQRHKAKYSDATGSVDLTNRDEEAEGLLKSDIELVDTPTSSTATFRSHDVTPVNEKSSIDKAVTFDTVEVPNTSMSPQKPKSVMAAFTAQVVLNIVAYGVLAFHTIALDQLMPVFFSLPPNKEPITSLFTFTGGLGMSARSIGWIFSGQAVYSMFFQLLVAPHVIRYFGYLRCFRLTAFTWPLLYIAMPYISLLPTGSLAQWLAIGLSCIWKTSWGSLAYLTILIMITNSVRDGGNEAHLGVVNGMSASFASGARALGPTIAGWLFNVGEAMGHAVLVWWLVAAIALLGAFESCFMRETATEGTLEVGNGSKINNIDGNGDDDDDDTVFGSDDENEHKKKYEHQVEELAWIQGEQEGQAMAGVGAPVGLGSTVLTLAEQMGGNEGNEKKR